MILLLPLVKDAQTKVDRLKQTVNHLSRVIPDLEIRATCYHPSSSSNKFRVAKSDSYAGTYDVDKVELVHSRLAAAVVYLNQHSQVHEAAASSESAGHNPGMA